MNIRSFKRNFTLIAMASVLVLFFQNCGPARLSTSSPSVDGNTDLGSGNPEDPNSSPTPTPTPGMSPTPTPMPTVTPTPTPTPTPVPDVEGAIQTSALLGTYCLNSNAGTSGATVSARNCRTSANQNWVLKVVNGDYTLSLKDTNFCLTANSRTRITTSDCNGQANQLWTLNPSGNEFSFVDSASGLCLNAGDPFFDDDASLSNCNGNGSQLFKWR